MKKILYPGTFDPMTNGHFDLIKRAANLSEELVVGIIKNPSKHPMFSVEERIEMIELHTKDLKNVTVDAFEGLLADYVKENEIHAVVRGIRSYIDFEYELQMAQVNNKLYDKMETVFLMTDERYSFISSSMVKEIFSLNGNFEELVPKGVYQYMKNRSNGGKE